jgi:hypothetical protein
VIFAGTQLPRPRNPPNVLKRATTGEGLHYGTAATVYHQLEHTSGFTFQIDEVDNLDRFND